MIRRLAARGSCFTSLMSFAMCGLAVAMVGGAPPADPMIARHVVQLVGTRGNWCSGAAIARDLVLTAAHCVVPGADYRIVAFDAARQRQLNVVSIARHPQFDLATLLAHRATADVALLKLAAPLPAAYVPAPLARERAVAVGEAFIVAGYGVTIERDGRPGETARAATLAATGQPGSLHPVVRSGHQRRAPRPRRLRRGFRRAGVRDRPASRHHRRGELDHGTAARRGLRRIDGPHAADAIPRMDRRNCRKVGLVAGALTHLELQRSCAQREANATISSRRSRTT